jgi:hypothetical protein
MMTLPFRRRAPGLAAHLPTPPQPAGSVVRLALAALLALAEPPPARADANPPERLTYQGYLTDGNGNALGVTAPKNYDIVFRIYDAQSGGDKLWTEQQTVTVDKGYFNILLGEGTQVSSESHAALSTVFAGSTASERYIEMTVKGVSGAADMTIAPRLRLLTAPYAFLASKAATADVATSLAGNTLNLSSGKVGIGVTSPQATLDVAGAVALRTAIASTAARPAVGTSRIASELFAMSQSGLSGDDGFLRLSAGGGTSSSHKSYIDLSGYSANSDVNDSIVFGTMGVERMRITSNGNVGIGNSSPGFPLNFGNAVGDKISFYGSTAGAVCYGIGLQSYKLQIHTETSQGAISFGYGSSAAMTETMNVSGQGTVTANSFRARGGWPGSNNANNVGFAFGGNGGDWDSGMFSDVDGYLRFTSNAELRLSVHPAGVQVHNSTLTVDGNMTVNGGLQEVYGWGIRTKMEGDTSRWVDFWRGPLAFYFTMVGPSGQSSSSRTVSYDGDSNWDFASDRKLKNDIVDAEPMLDRALQVQIRRYRWKDEDKNAKHKLGVIAQEVQPLFPDLVSESKDRDTGESLLSVGYSDFGMIAIKAVQELKTKQDAELGALKAQVAELARANAELRSLVERLTTAAANGR